MLLLLLLLFVAYQTLDTNFSIYKIIIDGKSIQRLTS